MTNKKNTGSYYTPNYLASFISKRVLSRLKDKKRLSVLEPSVGDGSFVTELAKSKTTAIALTALDINNEELAKAKRKWKKGKGNFERIDFLEFEIKKNFPVIIGNPPYIKK